MIVAPASSGRAASAPATAKPSMSGMLASSRTSANGVAVLATPRQRGERRRAAVDGGRPSSASAVSCSWRMRRLVALSSTISTGRPASMRLDGAAVVRKRRRRRAGAVKWNVLPRAELALDPDAAAHQLDERRRDRQAQAGAAEPARRRAVGLAEGLEDRGVLVRRDADAGVADREVQHRSPSSVRASSRTSTSTWPARGELDGVADQVGEHLPQPDRVADDAGRHVGRDVGDQLEALLVRAAAPAACSVSSTTSRERERHRLELQLARLDLREVEDVVEDRQQRLGRAT